MRHDIRNSKDFVSMGYQNGSNIVTIGPRPQKDKWIEEQKDEEYKSIEKRYSDLKMIICLSKDLIAQRYQMNKSTLFLQFDFMSSSLFSYHSLWIQIQQL